MNTSSDTIFSAHNHSSTFSDGVWTMQQINNEVKKHTEETQRKIIWAMTEHNLISPAELYTSEYSINTVGVEINTITPFVSENKTKTIYAHMLYYAESYKNDIGEILSGIRSDFTHNIQQNLQVLSREFDVSYEGLIQFLDGNTNINNFLLARYVLANPGHRKEVISRILNTEVGNNEQGHGIFIKNFLKPHGDHSSLGCHPDQRQVGISLERLSPLSQENTGWLVLPHAHTTFKYQGIQWFTDEGAQFCTQNQIDAIELPSSANKEWTQAISTVATKAGLKIINGADFHGPHIHGNHGQLFDMNTLAPKISTDMDEFVEKFCT